MHVYVPDSVWRVQHTCFHFILLPGHQDRCQVISPDLQIKLTPLKSGEVRLQPRLSAQQPGLPLRPGSITRYSWSTVLPSSFSYEPATLSNPVSHLHGQIVPEHLMYEAYGSHPEHKEMEDSVTVPSTQVHCGRLGITQSRTKQATLCGSFLLCEHLLPSASQIFLIVHLSLQPFCLPDLCYLYFLKSYCFLSGF